MGSKTEEMLSKQSKKTDEHSRKKERKAEVCGIFDLVETCEEGFQLIVRELERKL
jgi:hypothetical protein